MPNESLISWMEGVLKISEALESLTLEPVPDDSFGWGALLQAMWEYDPQSRPGGLLLTGPDGCGKHTAAAHMLRILAEDGYTPVFLDRNTFEVSGFREARERLDALLNQFYDEQQPLCIILEQMEHCPCRLELMTYLGRTLLEYRADPDQTPPLFLILIDQHADRIPSILRRSLRLCRMSMPTLETRTRYLHQNAASLQHYIPLDRLALAADGFTYSQLADLVCNLGNLLDSQNGILTEADWRTFLSGQLPEQPQSHVLRDFIRSAQQFLHEFPQLLQETVRGISLCAPQGQEASTIAVNDPFQSVSVPDAQTPAVPENEMTLTFENLNSAPPRLLFVNVLGEEFAQSLEDGELRS